MSRAEAMPRVVLATRRVLVVLATGTGLALAQSAPATAREAGREQAAATRIELLRELPWQPDELPRPGGRWGERLTLMAFSGDGRWLAVRGDVFVEVATGTARAIPEHTTLLGPAAGDGFLLRDHDLVRASASGRRDPIAYATPDEVEADGSPSGACVLFHGRRYVPNVGDGLLVELDPPREHRLPIVHRIVTAIAWSPDERRCALALAFDERTAEQIVVFARDGSLVQRLRPDSEQPVTALAFDLDGESIVWSGRRLHRASATTGRRLAWGQPRQVWLAPISAHALLGHDGRVLTLFTHGLTALRHIDLDVADGDDVANAAALSPQRDLLAIATPQALRLYRITP
ncbi:MAG TPA: hypothetical protein VFZ65_09430 [Planctomycetota bacterium]|nr:hypothetical protein [Planctomycetota bacterium]